MKHVNGFRRQQDWPEAHAEADWRDGSRRGSQSIRPSRPTQSTAREQVSGVTPESRSERALVWVIIASPIRLVRESLTQTLSGRAGLLIVDAINLDAAGLARIAEVAPDVVLVDLAQEDAAGAAQLVKNACCTAKLLAFALAEVDDNIMACAAAGFSGYVPQESGAEELYIALGDTVRGQLRCAPHISAAMFNRLADLLHDADARSLPMVTPRERDILMLVERGCSNKEIARQLGISCATVKNHMHSILQKLRVTRRGQAAARLRTGIR